MFVFRTIRCRCLLAGLLLRSPAPSTRGAAISAAELSSLAEPEGQTVKLLSDLILTQLCRAAALTVLHEG